MSHLAHGTFVGEALLMLEHLSVLLSTLSGQHRQDQGFLPS